MRQGNGPTFQTTNRIRPKKTTASDRKIVQRDASVPWLSKKFSMMPSDRKKKYYDSDTDFVWNYLIYNF